MAGRKWVENGGDSYRERFNLQEEMGFPVEP